MSTRKVYRYKGNEPRLSQTIEDEIKQSIPDFNLFTFSYQGTEYNDDNLDTLSLEPMLLSPPDLIKDTIPILKTLSDGQAVDDDGDGVFTLTALNPLNVNIIDGNGTDITTETKKFCYLSMTNPEPYYLKISGDLRLATQYGDPLQKDYTNATLETNNNQPAKYYKLPISAGACFAQPNLQNHTSYNSPTEWAVGHGFKPQPDGILNFPTTGFDGAEFNLNVIGVDAQSVNWQVTKSPTSSAINVTTEVTAKNTIRVILTGPTTTTSAELIGSTQFEIKDSSNKVKYRFELKKWFIFAAKANYFNAKKYCENLPGSYTLPGRLDLSNNSYGSDKSYSLAIDIAGGQNDNTARVNQPGDSNPYSMVINKGLLSEWSALDYYKLSGYYSDYYWVLEPRGYYQGFNVDLKNAKITTIDPNSVRGVICMSN